MPRPVALLLLLLGLSSCAGLPGPAADGDVAGAGHSVLLVNHGLHAGLLIARADLARALPALAETFATGDWVEIGWGDEDFYRTPQPSLGLALRALLRPTPAALHVQPIDGTPRGLSGGEVVEIRLSEAGYRRLLAFVVASFGRSAQGTPTDLGPGLFIGSRFYRAKGHYSLLRTCNTWLAEALAAGGCPLRPARLVTAGQLLSRLQQMPLGDTACRLRY